MKKIPLIITFLIILSIGGYFAHQHFVKEQPVVAWDLVPAESVFVFEKGTCSSCLNEIENSSIGKFISAASFYKKGFDSLRSLITTTFVKSNEALVSVNSTKRDDFDFVFYLSADDKLLSLSALSESFQRRTRIFNGIEIHELISGKSIFSIATFGNVWVGSFSPVLLEDVVRTYRGDTKTFRSKYKKINGYAEITDDAGNLFINQEKFNEFVGLFGDGFSSGQLFAKSSAMDVKYDESHLTLNGFTSDTLSSVLSVFDGQSPVSFGLKHVISNRTIIVNAFGITNTKTFSKSIDDLMQKKSNRQFDSLNVYSQNIGESLSSLREQIKDECAVVYVESAATPKPSKLLLIETASSANWKSVFKKIAVKYSVDTVFYERYGEFELRDIPLYRFPDKLLYPFVSGFNQSYYTFLKDLLIIADDLNELKSYLDDLESEDTWGKSVTQNKFLESTLLEANVSVYINTSKVWRAIQPRLNPRWQTFLRDNTSLVKSLGMSSIQFSHLSKSYYTNAVFTATPPGTKQINKSLQSVTFQNGLRNLYYVRSHVNRAAEVLVQDSLNNLMLIGEDGKLLWKLPIEHPIITDVVQVDYFNNGKLQYAFATNKAIHIIDRLGEYVEPFPVNIIETEVQYLTVVDYDNSKRYRFLITDTKGRLWMYDKEGKVLDGWNPKQVGGPLAMAPRHHRLKGKDFIVSIRKDGFVEVSNRRGENLKKFPLNTQSEPSGNYVVEQGTTLEQTYFVFVSRDGFRIRFNVDGKLQSKEALLKSSVTSNFSLIPDKSFKQYLIAQQDARQLILSDAHGKKILAIPAGGIKPSDIRFVDVGSGRTIIGIRDRTQNYTYIYDGDGTLLTSPPVESWSFDIKPVQSGSAGVYFIFENQLVVQPL